MQKIDSNSIKKEAVIVIALVAFIGGFLAGVIYSAVKSPTVPVQYNGAQSVGQPSKSIQQQSDQIFALEQELAANPTNIDAMIALGDIYLDSNMFQEGIGIFSKAEKIAPNNIHILNDLGILNMNTGNYETALTKFEAVLEIDPGQSHSLYHIGTIHRENGEKNKALQAFEKVLELNPSGQLAEQVQQEIIALNSGLLPQ
jgi:cytochrome c-type biogenesis protein CcmH/NrfG